MRVPTTLAVRVFVTAFPVFFMIALVPFVRNDFVLAGIYIAIIALSSLRYSREDFVFLVFGFFIFLLGELFFISMGVEVFLRQTLFGVMPIWLPFLWAYIFVAMKRGVLLFQKYLR